MNLAIYNVTGQLVAHRGAMPGGNVLDPMTVEVDINVTVSDEKQAAIAAQGRILRSGQAGDRHKCFWKSEPVVVEVTPEAGQDETPPDQQMRQAGALRLPGFDEE